jgi:hypothetical protein
MNRKKISVIELATLVLVALVIATGFVLFYTNLSAFETYVQEDGIAEWLTVVGLMLGAIVCFSRLSKLWRKKSKWFLLVTLLLGLFLFFAAGEEISWGQRIFGLRTPEYFMEHNAQHETNLHNLIVGKVKLNKLIFSVILVGALGVFLLFTPVLYQKSQPVRKLIDQSAIPVPRLYQVIAFLLVFILTSLIHHGKNAELLECGGALLFFLIVRFPKNHEIFKSV